MTNVLATLAVPPRGMLDTAKLRAWLLEKSDVKQGDWLCWHFNLSHKSDNTGVVTSYRLHKQGQESREEKESDIELLISDFKDTAQGIADLGSKMQGFVISAHSSSESDAPSLYQFHFTLKGNPGVIESVGEIESPDQKGMTTQFMRLLENTVEQSQKNMQFALTTVFDMQQKTAAQNLQLHADILNYRITMEQLADRKEERKAALRKEEREAVFSEQMTKMVLPVLGKFASSFLEKKGLIKSDGQLDMNGLKTVVENLSPKQLAEFTSTLTPDQETLFEPLIGTLLLSMPDKLSQVIDIKQAKMKEEEQERLEKARQAAITVTEKKDNAQ